MRLVEHEQSARAGRPPPRWSALRRLGLRTAYAGRFGSDDEGRFGFEALRAEGVNVECAEVVEGARNQIAYIVIDARTGERTVIWDRDERLAYSARRSAARLRRARARAPHGRARPARPAPASRARRARPAPSSRSTSTTSTRGWRSCCRIVDVLISSKEFPRRLTGMDDERAALVETKARLRADAVVGMTLGERGAVVYHEGRFVESRAFAVPGGCRDTTGAGDAFHAGFIYGLLRAKRSRRASRSAAPSPRSSAAPSARARRSRPCRS